MLPRRRQAFKVAPVAAGLRPRDGAAVGTAAGLVDCPAMRIPGFPASRAGNSNLAILFLLSVAFWSAPATAQPASPAAQPAPPWWPTGRCRSRPRPIPFGAADHTRVPDGPASAGYVEEEFLFSGVRQCLRLAAARSGRRPHRRTRRTPRACWSAGPPIAPASAARSIVEMLNPSNLFDLNIGWALSHSAVRPQRRRVGGHHGQAGGDRVAEDLQPDALRDAVVGQSAAAGRPAQLRHRGARQRARHRERPRVGHPSPGGAVAARAGANNPLAYGAIAAARTRWSGSTRGATRRPAATSTPTSTPSIRST